MLPLALGLSLGACSVDKKLDDEPSSSRSGSGRNDPDAGEASGPGSSRVQTVRVETGLSEDTALSDLDEEESREACEAVAEAAETVLSDEQATRFSCTLATLVDLAFTADADGTVDAELCEQGVEACIAEGTPPHSLYSCDPEVLDLEQCDAVIEEFETCFEDALSAVQEVADALSCDAASGGLDPALLEMALGAPPSCLAVSDKCPGFDASDSGDGEEGGTDDEPLSGPTPDNGCDNSCRFNGDGECDDGGPGSGLSICNLGTDCEDCGER